MLLKFGLIVISLGMLVTSCDSSNDAENDLIEITLLVAYTPEVRLVAGDIEKLLSDAVAEANQTYSNGGIDLKLTIVHQEEIAYQVGDRLQDLERLLRKQDGFLDEVHSLRDSEEADLVAFIVDNRSSTINGAIMAEEETAFVIVHWEHVGAPDYGMAHEIGHLFGARHTPDSDPLLEPFAFGHGYRNDSLRTIMANGLQERVPYYSGPDQRYEGVVLGDSMSQNVAQVLREAAVYISNFRGEQLETNFEPPGTWQTVELDAN